MSLPFTLPDWLPWWVPLAALLPALLYGLVFLLMPFSVIGVKGRLEAIEARLDEIQAELRQPGYRLAEPLRSEGYPQQAPFPAEREPRGRPPVIARAPAASEGSHAAPDYAALSRSRPKPSQPERDYADRGGPGARTEPRLDWPR
jgi:hypothetical protein